MRRLASLFSIVLLVNVINYQGVKANDLDSLSYVGSAQEKLTWVDRAPLESSVGIMLPIIAFDFAHLKQDDAIRSIRQQYAPSYHNRIEDFVIPVPLLTVWGMRLSGIEGRSTSHLEALTAQGMSMGIALGITVAGKRLIKRHRPNDSTTDYAFPSGHTATAFAAAAVLDAEYGADYPWLSALGYGLASSVGIARIANDRHWATDVVTGAGVGLFSTYVGYLLNDLFWGRGVKRFALDYERDNDQSPYLLSLQKSFNTLLSKTSGYETDGLGNSIGLVARVPLYKQIGLRLHGELTTSDNMQPTKEYLHGYALMVGGDFMQGFWRGRLWVDGNISVGYLSEVRLSEGQKSRSNSIPFIAPGLIGRIGIGATLLTANHFAIQFNGGYNYAPLSRPYSRENKKGLSGVDFGIGMTYVIDR